MTENQLHPLRDAERCGSMRVFALGGYGTFGRHVAENLCASNLVTELVVAGRDLDEATRCARELGDKTTAIKVDARDEAEMVSAAKDSDLIVNTAGPDYVVSYPAARAAIQAGANYCDLCADVDATVRLMELDREARRREVTVLLGMGASPGQTNLLMKHAALQLDDVDHVGVLLTYNLVGMMSHLGVDDPAKAASEMRRARRVNASWETVMNWGGGRVLIYDEGKMVEVNPLERLERVDLAGEESGMFFPIACPEAVTIPRYIKSVRSASYMMRVSPPQISDLYLDLTDQIRKKEISTAEATILFHEGVAAKKRESAPSLSWTEPKTSMFVVATGQKSGKRVRYSCQLASGWIGASLALSVAALRILRGEVRQRGVLAPEMCFDLVDFQREAAHMASKGFSERGLLIQSFEDLESGGEYHRRAKGR